jgi:hypothetical protein
VVTSQGREVGKLKAVEGDLVHLKGKDYWVPVTAIETIEDREVKLRPDYDYLGGPKRGGKSMGIVSTMARLAFIGLIAKAVMSYRDKSKREELKSKAKGVTDKAKAELNKVKSKQSSNGMNGWTPPASMTSTPDVPPTSTSTSRNATSNRPMSADSTPDTRPFSSLDLSDRTVSATEIEVIAEVTRAFPENTVRADAVGVHTDDGREIGTLRFTVDEQASTDIELSRLETPSSSAELLAQEVITDLRAQLPLKK